MRETEVLLEKRCAAPPEVVWEIIADPQLIVWFQGKARLVEPSGTPGTVGFSYGLRALRGGRRDDVRVVEADPPRLLREAVVTDFLSTSAPGEALHPSEQLVVLEPDTDGTVLRFRLTTPTPRWARGYTRWSVKRALARLLDRIADEAESRARRRPPG